MFRASVGWGHPARATAPKVGTALSGPKKQSSPASAHTQVPCNGAGRAVGGEEGPQSGPSHLPAAHSPTAFPLCVQLGARGLVSNGRFGQSTPASSEQLFTMVLQWTQAVPGS